MAKESRNYIKGSTIPNDEIKKAIKVSKDEEFFESLLIMPSLMTVSDHDIEKTNIEKRLVYFMKKIGLVDFLDKKYNLKGNNAKIGRILSVFTHMKAQTIGRTLGDIENNFSKSKTTKKLVLNKNYFNAESQRWVEDMFKALEMPLEDT